MFKGIDISEHQGSVDFTKVAKEVDFAILRTGYGQNTTDKRFYEYVKGCQKNKIPIHGVYHFMYASNNVEARNNAILAVAIAKQAGLPKSTTIWCDVEYDTIANAKRKGINLGNAEINLFTQTFCQTIEQAGYQTGIYANDDYCKNHYYASTLNKYPLWYAWYNSSAPKRECVYQQYTEKGRVSGISGNVDMNYYFGMVDFETMNEKENSVDKGNDAESDFAPVVKTPTYKKNKSYALQTTLKVRKGAGTNYKQKTYAELTKDGQKHDSTHTGCLDKGTVITCLEIKTVGKDVWLRCPSGWIAGFYNGNIYVK